jgi:AAA15 family ATPase/GTPase
MQIGLRNLRGLEHTGNIDIKPLTLLLGQNSSGKSTFLRTFPLLKQSVEARTTGPILWYGRFVDFGQFKDAVNDKTDDKFIEFLYNIPLSAKHRKLPYYSYNPLVEKAGQIEKCEIAFQIRNSENEIGTYCSKINLNFNTFVISININKKSDVEDFLIDGEAVKINRAKAVNFGSNFFPKILMQEREDRFSFATGTQFYRRSMDKIAASNKRKMAEATVAKLISQVNFNTDETILDSLKNQIVSKTFANSIKHWSTSTPDFTELKRYLLGGISIELLEKCDQYIEQLAKSTSYVAPLRATAERYYRPQDLSVDEVDFQGKNLALVLNNLNYAERMRFQDWCSQTFEFFPTTKYSGGNLTVNVKFANDNSEHNIADLGFGFSQILPIITQVWLGSLRGRKNRESGVKVYAIEQPELHLHPKLQTKLVNAIIKVVDYCKSEGTAIFFILETHSETIVNSIGTRIYRNQLNREDVNVVLFEKGENGSQVRSTEYDRDGTILEWPYGFFEEDYIF